MRQGYDDRRCNVKTDAVSETLRRLLGQLSPDERLAAVQAVAGIIYKRPCDYERWAA